MRRVAVMVTLDANVSERNNSEKFNLSNIKRRFWFKKQEKEIETAVQSEKKFSFKKFFHSKKKGPDIQFNSGFGE